MHPGVQPWILSTLEVRTFEVAQWKVSGSELVEGCVSRIVKARRSRVAEVQACRCNAFMQSSSPTYSIGLRRIRVLSVPGIKYVAAARLEPVLYAVQGAGRRG